MNNSTIVSMVKSMLNFFQKDSKKLAKENGFIKRKSKIDGPSFAKSLIIGLLHNDKLSLEQMSNYFFYQGIKVSKQAIHKRFNESSADFLKELLQLSIKKFKREHSKVIDLLSPFSGIYIMDSSGVSLPSSMQDEFPGYGGGASKSGMKVQVLLEYLSLQIKHLSFTGARVNDQGYSNHLDSIEPGSLYLQDLGYFNLSNYKKISDLKGYFISRFKSGVTVYDKNKEKIIELGKMLSSYQGDLFFEKVCLGKIAKFPVYLIAKRAPTKVSEKRIRLLRKEAKKRGRTIKKETLLLTCWSIYITNIPHEILPLDKIDLIYRVRWQIELFFKQCKSVAMIHHVSSKKSSRMLSEIYAKFIIIIILLHMIALVRWKEKGEISSIKAMRIFKRTGWIF